MTNRRLSLPRLLDRLLPSGTAVLFATAVVVGLGTGIGAVIFIRLISLVEEGLFHHLATSLPGPGRWWFLIIPALGGLVAGPIIAYFAREAKGHGVPEVMQAIVLNGGRIRPRVVVAKVLASAACIGSGGSAGREGPIVQVGAALGSTLGQLFHFSDARIRNLVACGTAAGIAATFNAPIAGVIFSVEIILGDLRLGELGSVVVSAVTASVLARSILGDRPAFVIPDYTMTSPWEIVLYFILGVFSAFVGVFFIKALYATEDFFDNWRFPEALKPGVGGLLLGGLALAYPAVLGLGFAPRDELLLGLPISDNIPRVFGAGFPVIEGALLGELSFVLLAVLVVLKVVATSLTLGSGNSGGVFAPGLFSGAMLGGAFGHAVAFIFPGMTAGVGPYATVGMAAVFAAAARAPLTAVLIVFEMTDDYRMVLPLMAAVIVATVVAQHLHPESIYTLKLARRGIHLARGRVVDVLESVTVMEVMNSKPVTVDANLPAKALSDIFLQTKSHAFPVVDGDGRLEGIVSLEDYRRVATREGGIPPDLRVTDIATQNLVVVYPDETVRVALQRMAPRDLSRLPVVSRSDPSSLLGIVRRSDVLRAYELGTVRRGQEPEPRLPVPPDTQMGEFIIEKETPAAGHALRELRIPREFVVVSIVRDGETIMPHGDTVLEPGDVVTVLAKGGDVGGFAQCLRSGVPQLQAPGPEVEPSEINEEL